MMCLFIPWDIYFTAKGVWDFNPNFIIDVKFLYLPIEEWLFFIIVPYACVFIYEVLNYFFPVNKEYNFINQLLFIKSLLSSRMSPITVSFIFGNSFFAIAIAFNIFSKFFIGTSALTIVTK